MIVRLLLLVCIALSEYTVHAQTWRLILPYTSYTVRINHLDPNKLYVGSESNLLYRSNDGGQHWEEMLVGNPGVGNALTSVFLSTTDTGTVFIAGFLMNGIRRSLDGGKTVSQVLSDPNFHRQWFISEAVIEDPVDPSIMYAARGTSYNSIYKSVNAGETWDSISVIPTAVTTQLCTITARPGVSGELYCGCKGGVIVRSTDSGITWNTVPVRRGEHNISPDAEVPKIIFSRTDPMRGYAAVDIAAEQNIADNGGLLQTTDGGTTWDRIAFSDTSLWSVELREHLDDTELYVGGFRTSTKQTVIKGDSLVFVSNDLGATWTRFENIRWNKIEESDTTRNVWMLRHDTVGNKMYMATQVGLYVLDVGASSIEEDLNPTLRVAIADGVIRVFDLEVQQRDSHWSIYTMSGQQIATGKLSAHGDTYTLPCPLPSSGSYLLLIGSERTFRTVTFSVVR